MSNTASTILILSLLFGTNPIYASAKNCKGGKCVAAFVKQKQSSNRQKENIYLVTTAYHNKKKQNLDQPFSNLQPTDNFISTDFAQNSIILDDQPLLTNLSPFVDEIDNIDNEKVTKEDEEIIILLDEEPMTIEYQCANEQEVIVCDTELRECECV